MAQQTHSAALHALKTVKLAGAGPLATGTLRAAIRAALIAAPYSLSAAATDAILVRVKHFDLIVKAGTLYMSDCGDAADASSMEYAVGEKREVRNCKELFGLATAFSAGAYDYRVELYS